MKRRPGILHSYISRGESMKRWAFNFAVAASLALCLATTALWLRSGWRYDQLNWFGPSWDGEGGHCSFRSTTDGEGGHCSFRSTTQIERCC